MLLEAQNSPNYPSAQTPGQVGRLYLALIRNRLLKQSELLYHQETMRVLVCANSYRPQPFEF